MRSTPTIATDCQERNAQAEASDLLRQVKALSLELRADADNLDPLTRQNQVSWHSHAFQLNYAREHVNEVGKRLAKLQGDPPFNRSLATALAGHQS